MFKETIIERTIELKYDIENLLISGNRLYGDDFIGYRIQSKDGKYLDCEFGEIYDKYGGVAICSKFNKVCKELKSGEMNWINSQE